MRRLFFFLLVILFPASVFATVADSLWMATHYTKTEVYVPMRDGKKLFTIIYAPKAKGSYPVLINRTPYSIAPYGANIFRAFWSNPYMAYCRENYIMVLQDVRGRYMSDGEFVDVRPYKENKKGKETDEASDTYDAVDWLVKHVKNNNGRVGIYGISYPGYYAAMGAMCGHPALKASSPQAPVTEWYLGDDFHHNGAFMEMDAFGFYSSFGKPRPVPTKTGSGGFSFPTRDNYKFYLEAGPLKNLAALMGDSIKFWTDLYSHPNYDKWWQDRNVRNYVQHIPHNVATLVVGGLYDAEDCYGAWNLYKAIERKADNNNKLVMGPWSHGGWSRGSGEYLGNVRFGKLNSEWYQQNIELPFFNYYLKGEGSVSKIKEANIFFSGANKWRTFGVWPPQDMQAKPLYLNASGTMSWDKPVTTDYASQTKYTSDPARPVPYAEGVHFRRTNEYMTDDQRFAARRTDVRTFATDVLKEDVTLAGPLKANLFVSLSTTDADFIVKLIDEFPDNFTYADSIDGKGNGKDYTMGGYQMLVRGEIMRGRYRNSFEQPEAFIPGKVTEVNYMLPDVAHVFKKGHRIMLQVQSTWFPLSDRNPQQFVDIYHCSEKDFVPCDITLYSSKDHPSNVELPVVR